MRVLDVEHRVLVAVLLQQFRVQGQRRIGREAGQRVADRVLAEPGDEVLELDDVAGPLGELGAVDGDQLADQDLDVDLGVVPGGGRNGLEPVDVAVVVGAEQVDLLGVAAVLLGQVVGGVGGEVRRLAVRADHHAVLVVTEVRGAQPDRAAVVVDVALFAEPRDGVLDRAGVVEFLLGEVDVEVDAELGEGALDVVQLGLVGRAADHRQRRDVGQFTDVRVLGQHLVAKVRDVLAGVAALRDTRGRAAGTAPSGRRRSSATRRR